MRDEQRDAMIRAFAALWATILIWFFAALVTFTPVPAWALAIGVLSWPLVCIWRYWRSLKAGPKSTFTLELEPLEARKIPVALQALAARLKQNHPESNLFEPYADLAAKTWKELESQGLYAYLLRSHDEP